MKNTLFILVLNICTVLVVVFLYDILVAKPRFDTLPAPTTVENRVDVELSDILNEDDVSAEDYSDSILIPLQTADDVPSLDPDYVPPVDDLILWEDLTAEEQKEIEEKMAPIY